MCACPSDSLSSSSWQASFPIAARNFRGALQLSTNRSVICHQQAPKKFTTEAIYMIFFLLAVVILTLIGSSIDIYDYLRTATTRKKLSDGLQKKTSTISEDEKKLSETTVWMKNCKMFLSCFSVLENGKSLLSTASNEDRISCFDGIRVIGLILVVLSHFFGFYVNVLRNAEENFLDFLHWNVFPKGMLIMDAYFMMSGTLIGYTDTRQYHGSKGKISWLSVPFRRFIKLTAPQIIVVGIYTTLFSYMGSGPVWPKYDTNPVCRESWIWNLLYLNNFLPSEQTCITPSWFLGCLVQLHLTSPLFLILLIRKPKMGYTLTAFASVFSCLTSFLLITKYNLVETLMLFLVDIPDIRSIEENIWTYFDIVHIKPYTRLGSYAAGIALGCYIRKKESNKFKKFSLVKLSFGWIIFIILLWPCTFGVIDPQGSANEIAAFHSIKPLLYDCCFFWVIFACATGQGGFLNKFLSCKFFQILSRLSYSGFLLHALVLEKYFFSFEEFIDHSSLSLVLTSTYLLLWTIVISFIFSLIFEKPVSRVYHFFHDIFQKKLHQKTK